MRNGKVGHGRQKDLDGSHRSMASTLMKHKIVVLMMVATASVIFVCK